MELLWDFEERHRNYENRKKKNRKKDLIDREIRKKYSERSTDITILFCC
jgi:hypothetical protein